MTNSNQYATAYFIRHPRTIQDLMPLHALEAEQAFVIAQRISLPPIDYENFLTDMTVDRGFIEENAAKCENGEQEVKRCLFVYCKERHQGVLVVPEEGRWVGEAAYYSERKIASCESVQKEHVVS